MTSQRICGGLVGDRERRRRCPGGTEPNRYDQLAQPGAHDLEWQSTTSSGTEGARSSASSPNTRESRPVRELSLQRRPALRDASGRRIYHRGAHGPWYRKDIGTTHWVKGDHIHVGPVNHIPVR